MSLTNEAHRFLRLGFSENEISRMNLGATDETTDDIRMLVRVVELLTCVIEGDQYLLQCSAVPEHTARAREIDDLLDGVVDAAKKLVAVDKEMIMSTGGTQ